MDGYLPSKGVIAGVQQTPEGGKISVTDMIKDKTREKFMEVGVAEKTPYVDFYNKKSGKVLAAFHGVILGNYGINAEANGYVRNNVQMRALEMVRADKL